MLTSPLHHLLLFSRFLASIFLSAGHVSSYRWMAFLWLSMITMSGFGAVTQSSGGMKPPPGAVCPGKSLYTVYFSSIEFTMKLITQLCLQVKRPLSDATLQLLSTWSVVCRPLHSLQRSEADSWCPVVPMSLYPERVWWNGPFGCLWEASGVHTFYHSYFLYGQEFWLNISSCEKDINRDQTGFATKQRKLHQNRSHVKLYDPFIWKGNDPQHSNGCILLPQISRCFKIECWQHKYTLL